MNAFKRKKMGKSRRRDTLTYAKGNINECAMRVISNNMLWKYRYCCYRFFSPFVMHICAMQNEWANVLDGGMLKLDVSQNTQMDYVCIRQSEMSGILHTCSIEEEEEEEENGFFCFYYIDTCVSLLKLLVLTLRAWKTIDDRLEKR